MEILYARKRILGTRGTTFELLDSWRKFKLDKEDLETDEYPSFLRQIIGRSLVRLTVIYV